MRKTLDVPFKLKTANDSGEFCGYASVFGVRDSDLDIVMPGAFDKTLEAWKQRGSLPALLWQHDIREPIGVYTKMEVDDVGLRVEGKMLIDADPLAKRAHAHMLAGSLTGLSIGFMLEDYEFDSEKDAFLLKEIDLWEVSVVTFPSNESARISDVKTALAKNELPSASQVERFLRDVGFSRKMSKTFMAKGYSALRDADEVSLDDVKSLFLKIEV